MCKGANFPATQVRGQKENAFAARVSRVIGLVSLVNCQRGNIFARVRRELAEVGKLSPERSEDAMNHPTPQTFGHLRKRHLQIAESNAPKTAMQEINQLTETNPACTGQRPWHQTQELHHEPDWQIFDSMAHSGSLSPDESAVEFAVMRDTRTVTSIEISCQ